MKVKKCLLYVLSFALLSTVSLIGSSSNANAWTGNLPTTTSPTAPTAESMVARAKELNPTHDVNSWVYVLNDASTARLYYTNTGEAKIDFNTDSGANRFTITRGYRLEAWSSASNAPSPDPLNSTFQVSNNFYSMPKVSNVTYNINYTGTQYPTDDVQILPCPNNEHIYTDNPNCTTTGNSTQPTGYYNDAVTLADRLRIKDTTTSDIKDISTSWSSYLNTGTCSAYYQTFLDQLSTGEYAVMQNYYPNTNNYEVTVISAKNTATATTFWGYTTGTNTYRYVQARDVTNNLNIFNLSLTNNVKSCNYNGSSPSDSISKTDTTTLRIKTFLSTFDMNAPTGYTGLVWSDTADIISGTDYLEYRVENKNATFTLKDIPEEVTECRIYVDDNPSIDNDDSLSEDIYDFTDCSETEPIYHTFAELGHYYVRVELTYPNGIRQYTVNLNIDGTTYGGTVSESGTTELGQQECSITALQGCISNALYWLGITPTNSLNLAKITENSTNTHGILGVVSAPVTALTTLSQSSNTCTPMQLPLPFVNNDITLPCLSIFYEEELGAFYDTYQVIITGFISYFIVANILLNVKNFKDPKNDKIEIMQL